ncbi:MAG: hypothetical protein Q9N26_02975 [Aquificota bacterium]|nr:hypothetical protein [Aquificota bacterium]
MVDPDILLIAIVEMIEGVKNLIGDKGANAVLRDAGRHSGPRLLESLIGKLPEVLDKEEALRRACMMLEELGFAKKVVKEDGKITVENDIFSDAIREETIDKSPVIYFFMGLLEGFVQFMSEDKVVLTPQDIQKGRFVFSYS